MKKPKKMHSFRLKERTMNHIRELAVKLEMSQAEVVEYAVNQLAKKEL